MDNEIIIYKRYRCKKAKCVECKKDLFVQLSRFNRIIKNKKQFYCKSCTLSIRNKLTALLKINCKICGNLLTEENTVKYGKKAKRILTCKKCSKEQSKNKRRNIKLKVIEHYGGKCTCCGESRLEFLTIDHVNNDGNNHRKSKPGGFVGTDLYSELVRKNFDIGYELQVLCWNCNLAKYHYGICPHQSYGE